MKRFFIGTYLLPRKKQIEMSHVKSIEAHLCLLKLLFLELLFTIRYGFNYKMMTFKITIPVVIYKYI